MGKNHKGYNLFYDLGRAVQINDSLVDSHLVPAPGLRSLPTWGFARGDAENLRRHPYGPLHLEGLLLGTFDQVGAH